jgi:hypothetical protein
VIGFPVKPSFNPSSSSPPPPRLSPPLNTSFSNNNTTAITIHLERYWHTVENAPGFAMAVVARECNMTNVVKANPVFTGLIMANHISAGLFGGDAYALKRAKAVVRNG